jgi:tetratricopeptide (TPR) repeat protein
MELHQKGKAEYQQKNYDKAIEYLDEAIKQNPELKEAYNYKSLSLCSKGEPNQALTCINEILSKFPNDLFSNQIKIIILIPLHNFEEVIRPLYQLYQQDKADEITRYLTESLLKEVGVQWCLDMLNIGKEDDFAMYMVGISQELPKEAVEGGGFFLQEGIERYKLGQFDFAVKFFDYAIKIDPNIPMVYYYKGEALKKQLLFNDALICFEKCIEIDNACIDAYLGKGHTLMMMKRYNESLVCYDTALELNPGLEKALIKKSICLRILGRYKEAVELSMMILKTNPNNIECLYNRALSLNSLNRADEANSAITKAIEIDLDNMDILIKQSNALEEVGDIEGSLYLLNKFLELRPPEAKLLSDKASILIKLDRFDEALVSCNKAIKLDPNFIIPYVLKLKVYYKIKIYDEDALRTCDKLIELKPNDYKSHFNKGKYLQNAGHYVDSKESFLKSLKMDPNNPHTTYNLSLVMCFLNDFKEAIKYFKLTLDLGWVQADVYQGLGYAQMNLLGYSESFESYQKSLELNPSNLEVLRLMAVMNYELKKYKDALGYIERVIRINPNFENCQDLKEQIVSEMFKGSVSPIKATKVGTFYTNKKNYSVLMKRAYLNPLSQVHWFSRSTFKFRNITLGFIRFMKMIRK